MILRADQFEEYIDFRSGFKTDRFEKIAYDVRETGILLRLIDIRTYGGQARCYLDSENEPIVTGSNSVPMRIKRPFRLAAQSSYIFYSHLQLRELPEDVIAYVQPSSIVQSLGIVFSDNLFTEGDIEFSAIPLRALELCEYFPIGSLRFSKIESSDEVVNEEVKTDSESSNKRKTNEKSSSSKRK